MRRLVQHLYHDIRIFSAWFSNSFVQSYAPSVAFIACSYLLFSDWSVSENSQPHIHFLGFNFIASVSFVRYVLQLVWAILVIEMHGMKSQAQT